MMIKFEEYSQYLRENFDLYKSSNICEYVYCYHYNIVAYNLTIAKTTTLPFSLNRMFKSMDENLFELLNHD